MNQSRENKITCGGIEPQFYEKLYPIVTQVPYPTHTPHETQTHFNPTKLITINLQFFKKVMFRK